MARSVLAHCLKTRKARPMSAARPLKRSSLETEAPRSTTLLELVRAIGEVTDDDHEVVATVLHLLKSGRVRLIGNFRNAHPDDLR